MSTFMGRYTVVILTTAIFLALVLGVLGVNFGMSYQTELNAEVVNVAGRQRMLSQRVAKALGNVRSQFESGESYASSLQELKSASNLFNRTLLAFRDGGTTLSTKGGETTLPPVQAPAAASAVNDALELWQPLYLSIQALVPVLEAPEEAAVLGNRDALLSDLRTAQAYVDGNINAVLKLMNDLTNFNEGLANGAANTARYLQMGGIAASLLCFAIIMWRIFGQLRIADRAASDAREETQQIFNTVDQGLFVLDPELRMGSEHSRALESIFSTSAFEGRDFRKFLSGLVSADDLDKTERYLKLLFDPRKRQRLLKDLNPLNQLAIQVDDEGELRNKYLNFSFTRIVADEEIQGVLTSVTDITKEVLLARELESETRRNEQQLEMIAALMGADGEMLPDFIHSCTTTYECVNELLRNPADSSEDLKDKANAMVTVIHAIKGEAAALGLGLVSETCHEFETQVERLMSKARVTGDEFLSLTVLLDSLISTNQQIQSLYDSVLRRAVRGSARADGELVEDVNGKLSELASVVAARQEKRVTLSVAGFDNRRLPSSTRLQVTSLASQLLRNAIAHGIESPDARQAINKSPQGQVQLALYDLGAEGYRLICEDDGAGVDYPGLARRAVQSGLLSDAEASRIEPRKLIQLMLSKRLSTRASADADAGRGAGMSVIGDLVGKLGAKIAVQSKADRGTRFVVRIPQSLKAAA